MLYLNIIASLMLFSAVLSPCSDITISGKISQDITISGIYHLAICELPMYVGCRVEVSGVAIKSESKPPPVTRSDWVLQDDTGSVYVSGQNSKGQTVVVGVVCEYEYGLYILADRVTR